MPGEALLERLREESRMVCLRPGKARAIGRQVVRKWWGPIWGGVGIEGNVLGEVEWLEGSGTSYFRLIFNPQKVLPSALRLVGWFAGRVGWRLPTVWVERYDAAVDWEVHRGVLLLDATRHKTDALGMVAYGPETERLGYRKGSRLRVQVYDKTAERAAAGHGEETPGFLTRAEVQVSGLQDCVLADLPAVPCPMPPGVEVRAMAYDPATLACGFHAAVAVACRFGGIRYARALSRQWWKGQERAEVIETVAPVVKPSWRQVFADGWWSEVLNVLQPFAEGITEGGSAAAGGRGGLPALAPAAAVSEGEG